MEVVLALDIDQRHKYTARQTTAFRANNNHTKTYIADQGI
jgi:hypothetical protein